MKRFPTNDFFFWSSLTEGSILQKSMTQPTVTDYSLPAGTNNTSTVGELRSEKNFVGLTENVHFDVVGDSVESQFRRRRV